MADLAQRYREAKREWRLTDELHKAAAEAELDATVREMLMGAIDEYHRLCRRHSYSPATDDVADAILGLTGTDGGEDDDG